MSPMEEQPQYIYTTNGYVDQTGGPPPPVYYINGESRFRAYEQLPDADSDRPKQPDFQLLLLLGKRIWRHTDRALTEKVDRSLIAFGLSS